MQKRLFFIILLLIEGLLPQTLVADTYVELVEDVAKRSGMPLEVCRTIVNHTFKSLRQRLTKEQATTIPHFGRFSTNQRIKKNIRDDEGYLLGPRTVIAPRFQISHDFRKKLEAGAAP